MAKRRVHQTIAAWILGPLTLIFFMVAFFTSGSDIGPLQHSIARLIGAIMAGLFGFFLPGSIKLGIESKHPKWGTISIQAVSGVALFVLVYIVWGSDAGPEINVDVSEGGQAIMVVTGDINAASGSSVTIVVAPGLSGNELENILEPAIRDPEGRNAESSNASLEELRKSGDTTKLLASLEEEDARIENRVRQERAEQLKIKREIASVAFLAGEIETAREALDAILAIDPDDIDAVNRLGHIQRLRGDLVAAERSFRRVLTLACEDKAGQAAAYSNLGSIFETRGNLSEASAMHRKALDLHEQLGSEENMAGNYTGLGNVSLTLGDLIEAEAMYRLALDLFEQLGIKEKMANNYGNLGIVFKTRGDLDEAEAMHRRALAIYEQLGHKKGMATSYGNLGVVFKTRGDLDEAEAMYLRAIDLNEQLGHKEGMAISYGNLGNVYLARGDQDEAEAMYLRAIDLNEQLGSKEGMAISYGNLGTVYAARGKSIEAEAMVRKAIDLSEQLGSKEAIAVQYGNLGLLHEKRNEFDQARQAWSRALDLYKQVGVPDKIALTQSWLDRLP